MKILVIIPILNPNREILLHNLKVLVKEGAEILILDSNNSDFLKEQVDFYIKVKNFNHATTRNFALKYTNFDYYLFITQDIFIFEKDFLKRLIKPFQTDKNIVISYIRQIPFESANIIEKFNRNKNYPKNSQLKTKKDIPKLGIRTFFNSNSCSIYKADYFRKIGGFKEGLNTNEDMEFAFRAIMDNRYIFYNGSIAVKHSHNFNILQLFKRYLAIGRFFKENSYILENIKITDSGVKHAIDELKYIAKNSPKYLFKSIFQSFIKYIAFRIGKF